MKLHCQGNLVRLPSSTLQLEMPVLEALLMGNRVLVIHDYAAFPQGKTASNLIAYSPEGEKLWVAENPSTMATDAYVNFLSEQPLKVGNFAGFNCTLSVESGKIQSHVVTK